MSDRIKALWLFGLSGAGKTSIANCVRWHMIQGGFVPVMLDGDVMRRGICSDLTFSREDRFANVRRVAAMASHLQDSAVVPIVSLITPEERHRAYVRERVKGVWLAHIATPLDVCIQRDSKGLYELAKMGTISEFTGISSPFEKPKDVDFTLSTETNTETTCANQLYSHWLAS